MPEDGCQLDGYTISYLVSHTAQVSEKSSPQKPPEAHGHNAHVNIQHRINRK